MLKLKKASFSYWNGHDKNIICFGAGALAEFMLNSYGTEFDLDRVYVVDNAKEKDGKTLQLLGGELTIYSLEHFKQLGIREFELIITPVYFLNIIEQLDVDPFFDEVVTYIYPMMNREKTSYTIAHSEKPLIPKVIHYCWFGGGRVPDELTEIMKSWKKYCPDYEIVRWDESNYDISKNEYLYEAYKNKKYAYVSDYARKDILSEHGGIYLDTDVELLGDLEKLRYNEAFVGVDDVGNIASGAGLGAIKGSEIVRKMKEAYDGLCFVMPDGKLNLAPSGVNESRSLIQMGLKHSGDFQLFGGLSVFPRDVLLPISWCGFEDDYSEHTLMVHRFQHYVYGYRNENVLELKKRVQKMKERMTCLS